jgi:RNA polymerase sigma-54 factor
MKQSLSIKLGQQLAMTPQLQQAIRLLQLSTLDLATEIQQAIEGNPMLEMVEESDEIESGGDGADTESTTELPTTQASASEDVEDLNSREQDIPDELPVDSSWDDIYPTAPVAGSAPPEDDVDIDTRNSVEETLADHLRWQLNLTPMTDLDRLIATTIIDAVDLDGMLTVETADIASAFDPADGVEIEEVEAVLKRVQQFDPPGVAARNLKECLLIQLSQLDDAPWVKEAKLLVGEHLELLGSKDFTALARRLKLNDEDLAQVIHVVQSLNPRPGSALNTAEPEYVIPDVLVRKDRGKWLVELNPDAVPRLRINADYASLVRRADNSADNTFLRNHLQEARWFMKSLQSRNETLLKVATKIVEHQRGFLEYGDEAMKPLVLHDIAEGVEMHESTISRVTTRKYMHTPRGIYELKYFFSSHLATSTGGEVSSTAIRALIKKLTAGENPRKPLSDSKIAALLGKQNIRVARRTVAKYRESMAIPPSNERKKLV